MIKRTDKIASISLLTMAAVVGLVAFDADAQTSKRRKNVRSTAVVSPTPPATEPLVISRADEFPDENSQIVPVPSPSPETFGTADTSIDDLRNRIRVLETGRKDDDAKQKRLLLNLDILTKSEQRADTLRNQFFQMIEKENSIKGRIDQIDNDVRPETIERQVALVGSLRPEEIRAQKRKSLELEKQNLQNLLSEVQKNKTSIEQNLTKADALVERLRTRLEKEIDTALTDDSEEKPERE